MADESGQMVFEPYGSLWRNAALGGLLALGSIAYIVANGLNGLLYGFAGVLIGFGVAAFSFHKKIILDKSARQVQLVYQFIWGRYPALGQLKEKHGSQSSMKEQLVAGLTPGYWTMDDVARVRMRSHLVQQQNAAGYWTYTVELVFKDGSSVDLPGTQHTYWPSNSASYSLVNAMVNPNADWERINNSGQTVAKFLDAPFNPVNPPVGNMANAVGNILGSAVMGAILKK